MNEYSEAKPAGDPLGSSPVVGAPAPGRPSGPGRLVVGQAEAESAPDLGIIIGAFLSGSGILVGSASADARGSPDDSTAAATFEARLPSAPASGPAAEEPPAEGRFVVPGGGPGGFAAPGSFDRAFRREVAARICDVLVKAYSTQREFVQDEARRRNLSVEQLLAAYLARIIMEKVDNEYL